MPPLFPDWPTFALCALIMAAAQLIYATVGFGAGMFSVALLALVLPDLAPAVATLMVLTFVTEVWVLAHSWRQARGRLLIGLLPTMALGLWLGTHVLATADVSGLKRGLGFVVAAAGAWFLFQHQRAGRAPTYPAADEPRPEPASPVTARRRRGWSALPAGLVSGVLAGMFGTGGPPVIVFLRAYGLDKGAFRATILWYFLIMSLVRAVTYTREGLLTTAELYAALWLLPASLIGMGLGMVVHHRVSERQFSLAVAVLLVLLGVLLVVGVGR